MSQFLKRSYVRVTVVEVILHEQIRARAAPPPWRFQALVASPIQNCASFLDPLIEAWDIDLAAFSLEVGLTRRVAPGEPKKFAFAEEPSETASNEEPGVKELLDLEHPGRAKAPLAS